MNKNILMIVAITILLAGCSSKVADTTTTQNSTDVILETSESTLGTTENTVNNSDSTNKEYDYFNDYDKEISTEVNIVVEATTSLQDELNKVKKIAEIYSEASSKANNQNEINSSSIWTYTVWDKELNNLWKRISNDADKNTKKLLLDSQRNWIAMKESIVLENIGSKEDSGSIYPLQKNNLLSDITCNRCYILARELAKIKNENFTMPERSLYGTYVDNQGTNSIYSSLITRKNIENDNEAKISIYRLGQTEGTFTNNNDGTLSYTSYEENIKGIIKLDGWNKATFEVTESKDSPFNVGESFTFDFVI